MLSNQRKKRIIHGFIYLFVAFYMMLNGSIAHLYVNPISYSWLGAVIFDELFFVLSLFFFIQAFKLQKKDSSLISKIFGITGLIISAFSSLIIFLNLMWIIPTAF